LKLPPKAPDLGEALKEYRAWHEANPSATSQQKMEKAQALKLPGAFTPETVEQLGTFGKPTQDLARDAVNIYKALLAGTESLPFYSQDLKGLVDAIKRGIEHNIFRNAGDVRKLAAHAQSPRQLEQQFDELVKKRLPNKIAEAQAAQKVEEDKLLAEQIAKDRAAAGPANSAKEAAEVILENYEADTLKRFKEGVAKIKQLKSTAEELREMLTQLPQERAQAFEDKLRIIEGRILQEMEQLASTTIGRLRDVTPTPSAGPRMLPTGRVLPQHETMPDYTVSPRYRFPTLDEPQRSSLNEPQRLLPPSPPRHLPALRPSRKIRFLEALLQPKQNLRRIYYMPAESTKALTFPTPPRLLSEGTKTTAKKSIRRKKK
jgi:hypothetical protein